MKTYLSMNYPSLYTSLQTITTNTQPMNWNYTQINANHLYKDLAKDFLEKYAASNTIGISCTSHYYNSDTLISLHIHQNGTNYLYELVGHTNFVNAITTIGIPMLKYHTIVHTSQPVGKKCVMVTFYGYAEISGRNFQVESTIIFKMVSGSPRIINQVINIFL